MPRLADTADGQAGRFRLWGYDPQGAHDMSQPKNHVHVQATVGDHGSVTLDRLPYQSGQRVDVTISPVDVPPAARSR
jgi:hypothetical protein